MDPTLVQCVASLHQQASRWALVVTGGGIRLGGWLLSVPGGSRTVLEIQHPYDTPATEGYLGHPLESFCSPKSAALLAHRARDRASWLAPRQPVLGLGGTASLRSEHPKRGDHRIHIATASECQTQVWSLTLLKEARSRDGEDEIAARLGLYALCSTLGLAVPELPLLPGEEITQETRLAQESLSRFLRAEIPLVCLLPDGRERSRDVPLPRAVVPGSFNPLHAGHLALARLASERVGSPTAFELSIENVEKPSLEPAEIRWRAEAFRWRSALWLTRAPRFVQKARLFPGALFAVGADTAARLVQPRFYNNDPEQMHLALKEIRGLGCRFLVAGRVDSEGVFQGLDQLTIPEQVLDLFEGLPESAFRCDLSSTELRQRE